MFGYPKNFCWPICQSKYSKYRTYVKEDGNKCLGTQRTSAGCFVKVNTVTTGHM